MLLPSRHPPSSPLALRGTWLGPRTGLAAAPPPRVALSRPGGVVLARAAGGWPGLPPARAVQGGGWAAGRQFGQTAGQLAAKQLAARQLAPGRAGNRAGCLASVRLGGQAVRRQGRPAGLRLRRPCPAAARPDGPGRARRPVSVAAAQ
jgi:hypothetical protein